MYKCKNNNVETNAYILYLINTKGHTFTDLKTYIGVT